MIKINELLVLFKYSKNSRNDSKGVQKNKMFSQQKGLREVEISHCFVRFVIS